MCGGKINNNAGHLTSPNYPDDYHPNKNCVWVITVSQGYTVGLVFDYLEVSSIGNSPWSKEKYLSTVMMLILNLQGVYGVNTKFTT